MVASLEIPRVFLKWQSARKLLFRALLLKILTDKYLTFIESLRLSSMRANLNKNWEPVLRSQVTPDRVSNPLSYRKKDNESIATTPLGRDNKVGWYHIHERQIANSENSNSTLLLIGDSIVVGLKRYQRYGDLTSNRSKLSTMVLVVIEHSMFYGAP